MTWYGVTIEFRFPDGSSEGVTDDAIDTFMSLVEPHDGVASGGEGHATLDATIGVITTDPTTAVTEGRHIVRDAASQAGLPDWPIVRVEALREDVLDEENAWPQLPDLASGAEAADILGVSRQRVYQLRRAHPHFPAPVYELGTGPLWMRSAIEAFARRWERVSGRHVEQKAS